VSDVPLASFTSGGVDSNLVAAIARETRPDLHAYTADMEDAENEAPDAEDIARHLGMPIRRVACDRVSFLRAWPEAVEALEHPTCSPSYVCALLVARAARADGVVVAMTGEGADELFGGYDFLERTRRRWRTATRWWSRAHPKGRALRKRLREAPFDYQTGRTDRGLHRRLTAALLPEEESRPRALFERFARVEPPADRAFLAHSIDALHRHLGWILLRHDRLCMASSIEARVPFLCAGVSDVAFHTPVRWRIRGRTGKWILKRVAARRLPRRHVFARKRGYPVPARHHEGTEGILRGGAAADLFRWTHAAEAEILPRLARDAYLRQQAVTLEVWARLYLREEPASAIADRMLSLAGAGPRGG
jgi:asparagine synthase (glutamine-hydrolysing)